MTLHVTLHVTHTRTHTHTHAHTHITAYQTLLIQIAVLQLMKKQVRGVSCGCGRFSQDAHLSADNPCRDTSTPTLIITLNGEGNLLSFNIELPFRSLLLMHIY